MVLLDYVFQDVQNAIKHLRQTNSVKQQKKMKLQNIASTLIVFGYHIPKN